MKTGPSLRYFFVLVLVLAWVLVVALVFTLALVPIWCLAFVVLYPYGHNRDIAFLPLRFVTHPRG